MIPLFDRHGLVSWSEREIEFRDILISFLSKEMLRILADINRFWMTYRCETPIIMPANLLSGEYSQDQIWSQNDGLVLRPETTPGSYVFARHLLANNVKAPLCVWQAGKSFRRECHSKSYIHMSLDEFWQLEFQCIYAEDSKADYFNHIKDKFFHAIQFILGKECRLIESDRTPEYSLKTMDIECCNGHKFLECVSISLRKDFNTGFLVVEVAAGLDRLVHLKMLVDE